MENNTLILCLVTVIVLVALIGLFVKMKSGFGVFNLKVYGITLVISIGALVTLSDLPSEKIAPFYGILGVIAGYLFGIKQSSN